MKKGEEKGITGMLMHREQLVSKAEVYCLVVQNHEAEAAFRMPQRGSSPGRASLLAFSVVKCWDEMAAKQSRVGHRVSLVLIQ